MQPSGTDSKRSLKRGFCRSEVWCCISKLATPGVVKEGPRDPFEVDEELQGVGDSRCKCNFVSLDGKGVAVERGEHKGVGDGKSLMTPELR